MEFFLLEYSVLDSSQTKIKELSNMGKIQNRSIVIAKKQTNTYGRNKGSIWQQDEGDLAFSFMIEDNSNILYHLPFIVALTVVNTISPITSQIKWPNDIMVDGKKVSGIIVDKIDNKYFIGIGINIKKKPEPYNYIEKYSQIFEETVTKEALLQKFIKNFDNIYNMYQKLNSDYNLGIYSTSGFSKIRNMFLEKAYKLNEEISFNINQKKITGIFKDIDENGAIILSINSKEQKFFYT